MKPKSKFFTIIFSMFPGAGHMYMGYLAQGTQLMVLFLLVGFIVADFRLSLLGFFIPVIWFYSVFDAYHRYEGTQIEELSSFNLFEWLQQHPKWIGWALIILGSFMVMDRILFPLIPWEWRGYFQTAVVAGILIFGGVKLLMGTRIELPEDTIMPSNSAEAEFDQLAASDILKDLNEEEDI